MSDNFFTKFPVRIFGLGIAIGEALKYITSPEVANLCSALACTYILCHAAYECVEGRQDNTMVPAMFDSLIFDGLASALLPTLVTYHTSRVTFACLKEGSTVPDIILTYGPTVVGLCMLSLTTEPIDQYVNQALSDSVRRLYQ